MRIATVYARVVWTDTEMCGVWQELQARVICALDTDTQETFNVVIIYVQNHRKIAQRNWYQMPQ